MIDMQKRRTLGALGAGAGLAGLGAFGAALPRAAHAQAGFPDRPIKWIVPFGAGGGMDAISRMVATEASTRLGQPLIIENRTGAGGTIGTAAVVQAPPDGYTIMTIDSGSYTTAHHLYSKLSFNSPRDLRIVATLVRLPVVLVVGANHQAKTFQELIAWARQNPGKLDYGSVGAGVPLMIGMELLQMRTGTKFQHVPYRGMPAMLTDLSTGQTAAALSDYGSAKPFLDSGRVRMLAVATETRQAFAPNVPTFEELGVKNLPVSLWHAAAVPAKTPDAIVERLARAFGEAIQSPAVKAGFEGIGGQAFFQSGKAVEDYARDQVVFWEPIVKPMNIKLD